MSIERFRWLAAIVSLNPGEKIIGRVRLQKEIKLLQSIGLPSDYKYISYHYGPYSEEVQSDLRVIDNLGLVSETPNTTSDGRPFYEYKAAKEAYIKEAEAFRPIVQKMSVCDTDILELAATYQYFIEKGIAHEEALESLRRKKKDKCTPETEQKAFKLLEEIGLFSQ